MTPLTKRLILLLRMTAIALGLFHAWCYRWFMNPDAMSYLDIADLLRKGDWTHAVNAYWSPLYPCLLALLQGVSGLSPDWEFPLAHLANVFCYLAALAGFEFFLKQLGRGRQGSWLPESLWVILAYTLFFCGVVDLISLVPITPDLLVAAAVFTAAGFVVRIQQGNAGIRSFTALGAILGLGYLAKAPLFVVSFFFLAAAFWSAPFWRKALVPAAAGLGIFLLTASLYAIPISLMQGKPSFGASARLNYDWNVMGLYAFPYDSAARPADSIPLHPYPVLVQDPTIFDYRGPVSGTYPVWFDPPYWYEGLRLHWNTVRLFQTIWENAAVYLAIGIAQRSFFVGLAILLAIGWKSRGLREWLVLAAPVVVPPLVALAMFVFVHVETRFIGAFVTLVWLGLLSSIRLPEEVHAQRWARMAVLIMTLPPLLHIARYAAATARRDWREGTLLGNPVEASPHLQVAHALRAAGLKDGEAVGTLDGSYTGYWARLAKVRILAEAKDPEAFWQASSGARQISIAAMQKVGIKALVAKRSDSWQAPAGWQPIGRTGYWFSLLREHDRHG